MTAELESKEKPSTPTETASSTDISQERKLSKPVSYYQKRIYDICKADYPALIQIAKYFIDRTRNNNDNQVAVEGVTGSGKSMLTFIITHLMEYMNKRNFNFDKQAIFVPDEGELKRKMIGLPKFGVFWIDEAIRSLDKHFWYKVDQIELNQIAKTRRKNRNTIFYNIQRFKELTETFRNHNIQSRLYIINRFAVVLFIRDDDKDVDDPWHTKENLSIKYRNKMSGLFRYNVLLNARERLSKETSLPNYFAHSTFFSLDDYEDLKEYWDWYEELADFKSRAAMEKQAIKKEGASITKAEMKYRKILAGMIKKGKDEGLTTSEFNARHGLNLSYQDYSRLHKYNITISKEDTSAQT